MNLMYSQGTCEYSDKPCECCGDLLINWKYNGN